MPPRAPGQTDYVNPASQLGLTPRGWTSQGLSERQQECCVSTAHPAAALGLTESTASTKGSVFIARAQAACSAGKWHLLEAL